MAMLALAFVLGAGSMQVVKAAKAAKSLGTRQAAPKLNLVTGSGLHIAGIRPACQRFCDVVPDPLAEIFVGSEYVDNLIATYAKLSMLVVLGRPRWIDTRIKSGVAAGIRQVVILGAGMDARAYYLTALKGCAVFEVDVPEVVQYKEAAIAENHEKVPPILPSKLERIGANLENSDWTKLLLQSGFSTEEPAIWVLEGLVYYLNDADATSLLATIRTLATPDSIVCFDVPNKAFRPKVEEDTAKVVELEKLRSHFKFTTESPETWLGDLGFKDIVVSQLGEERVKLDVVDWNPDNAFAVAISMSHLLPREVDTDSYGRLVHRFFWVEAKFG